MEIFNLTNDEMQLKFNELIRHVRFIIRFMLKKTLKKSKNF